MDDSETGLCRGVAARATLAAILAMLVMPRLAGFRVDLISFWPLYMLVAIFAVFIPYTAWRDMRRLRSALEASTMGLAMTLPVLVFSYAAMRSALPLADGWLLTADRAIGFDWPGFVRWVDDWPRIAAALAYGYSSFSLQLLFLPVLLALLGFEGRAYRMMLGYLLLCCASIAIGIVFPALAAYAGHGLDVGSLAHVNAHFGHAFITSLTAVREDPAFTLSLGRASGIITFPSIHAGVALLCGWAAWASRPLRLPFLALNLLMAVSAITHGGHYLVDVIAGPLVAAAAIAAAVRLTRPAAARTAAIPVHRQAVIRPLASSM